MTRQEFLDDIYSWDDLKRFCFDEDCDIMDYVVLGDDLNEAVNDDVDEYHGEYAWDDLRDFLSGIREGYEAYCKESCFDYIPLDESDFRIYKDEIFTWAVENDIFMDEEDEESEVSESDFDEPEEEFSPNEDISIQDLLVMCSAAASGAIDNQILK